MRVVEDAKAGKRDMEGSWSVLSMDGPISGIPWGKGMETTEAAVPERELAMKGRLAGVVTTVTAVTSGLRRRRRARWRRGIVCPFDMNGKSTMWLQLESLPAMKPIFLPYPSS